jgi:hypothetical protein
MVLHLQESAQPLLLVCSDRVLNMAHQREPCSQCRPQITRSSLYEIGSNVTEAMVTPLPEHPAAGFVAEGIF